MIGGENRPPYPPTNITQPVGYFVILNNRHHLMCRIFADF